MGFSDFMQSVGNAPGASQAPGQGAAGLSNQMPNAQNAVGSPRPYDPLAVFFERLIAGHKALAEIAGKNGDMESRSGLEKMATELRGMQDSRVKAFMAKQKAQQKVQELASMGAGGSNQGVSY